MNLNKTYNRYSPLISSGIVLLFSFCICINYCFAQNSEKNKESVDSINVYRKLSIQYMNKDLKISKKHVNRAIELSKTTNNKAKEANNYILLSNICGMEGNSMQRLSLLFDALKLAKELNDDKLKFKIFNNLGIVYANNQDFKKAEEYFLKSFQLTSSTNSNDTIIAKQHNNLGAIYAEQEQFDKAIRHLNESIKISLRSKIYLQLNSSYSNLADLYHRQNKHSLSNQYYQQLLDNLKNLDNAADILDGYFSAAEFYLKEGNYSKAIENVDKALAVGTKVGLISRHAQLYEIYAQCYEKLNKLDSAIYYQKRIIHITDSINQVNLHKANEVIDVKYEIRKQSKTFQLTQTQLAIEKKTSQFTIILLSAFVLLAIILGFGIFFYQKNRSKTSLTRNIELVEGKESIQKELERRQSKIEVRDEQSNSEKEVFLSIIETLESRKNEIKQENLKLINSIIKDLKSGMENKAWEEFEVRFKETHNSFYDNLNAQFPNLTPNEKKLCAFLRQGLSSREITNLTGQSTHSIEVARTRLRKKMGLSNTKTNLNEFLQNI